MTKKHLKIIAGITAFLLIIGLGIFANALVGNPISKMLATQSAQKYLEEHYADTDFYIDSVNYNFKDGGYLAHIKSPHSIDTAFALYLNMVGTLEQDTYESYVQNGFNTANRINQSYRELVDTILDSPLFPYDTHIAFGNLAFQGDTEENDPSALPYALSMEELELDKLYDIEELGARAGLLTFYLRDEVVTEEHLAEILLNIKNLFEQAGIPFYAIDCVLESPYTDARIEVRGFPFSDLYEDNLIERVRASNTAAIAWYSYLDQKK